MAFEFTTQMATLSNQLWAFTSAAGAGLCFLVLLFIGLISTRPESRKHLNRVSFHIVVYALIANTAFGIANTIGGMMTGPTWICGLAIFVLQMTLQVSSWLLFSIALNLQLVVIHGVNGQKMEKYYVIASFAIGIALTVPPYASGQYGWDVLEKDCWYTNDNKKQRLAWQIGTQMAWTAMTVLGEVFCSSLVMFHLLRHNIRLKRTFISTRSLSDNRSNNTGTRSAPQVVHANRYKSIILRISLYPLASCLVNLLSIVTALHSTASNGIHDTTDYNILLLSDFLYGGRSIAYALLAASDPAFVRGLQTWYSITFLGKQFITSSRTRSDSYQPETASKSGGVVVHVEFATFREQNQQPAPPENGSKASVLEIQQHPEHQKQMSDLDATEAGLQLPPDSEYTSAEQAVRRATQRRGRHADIRREEEEAFKRQI